MCQRARYIVGPLWEHSTTEPTCLAVEDVCVVLAAMVPTHGFSNTILASANGAESSSVSATGTQFEFVLLEALMERPGCPADHLILFLKMLGGTTRDVLLNPPSKVRRNGLTDLYTVTAVSFAGRTATLPALPLVLLG